MELQGTKQIPCSQATSLWLVGLVTALAILPVFLVEIPAMNDYPGHLARSGSLERRGSFRVSEAWFATQAHVRECDQRGIAAAGLWPGRHDGARLSLHGIVAAQRKWEMEL